MYARYKAQKKYTQERDNSERDCRLESASLCAIAQLANALATF